MCEQTKLPSKFQIGDRVKVESVTADTHAGAVTGVLFRDGKVLYEVHGALHDSCDTQEI